MKPDSVRATGGKKRTTTPPNKEEASNNHVSPKSNKVNLKNQGQTGFHVQKLHHVTAVIARISTRMAWCLFHGTFEYLNYCPGGPLGEANSLCRAFLFFLCFLTSRVTNTNSQWSVPGFNDPQIPETSTMINKLVVPFRSYPNLPAPFDSRAPVRMELSGGMILCLEPCDRASSMKHPVCFHPENLWLLESWLPMASRPLG